MLLITYKLFLIVELPMNKIQVGSAASPNLKVVKSKIGSLQNATYKPGGGNIKIENRKMDFSTTSSRITAKNENYTPRGGDKKVILYENVTLCCKINHGYLKKIIKKKLVTIFKFHCHCLL